MMALSGFVETKCRSGKSVTFGAFRNGLLGLIDYISSMLNSKFRY